MNKLGKSDAPVVKVRLLPVPNPIQHKNIDSSTNLVLSGLLMSSKIRGIVNSITKVCAKSHTFLIPI